eukprot:10400694-Karenia_brevis.AAC.1
MASESLKYRPNGTFKQDETSSYWYIQTLESLKYSYIWTIFGFTLATVAAQHRLPEREAGG